MCIAFMDRLGDATDGMPVTDVFVETTKVEFGVLSQDIIEDYIASGEPMDKAGAQNIAIPRPNV